MREGKVRMQKPKAEASYGNGYLQGVKLALTHFPQSGTTFLIS